MDKAEELPIKVTCSVACSKLKLLMASGMLSKLGQEDFISSKVNINCFLLTALRHAVVVKILCRGREGCQNQ